MENIAIRPANAKDYTYISKIKKFENNMENIIIESDDRQNSATRRKGRNIIKTDYWICPESMKLLMVILLIVSMSLINLFMCMK